MQKPHKTICLDNITDIEHIVFTPNIITDIIFSESSALVSECFHEAGFKGLEQNDEKSLKPALTL